MESPVRFSVSVDIGRRVRRANNRVRRLFAMPWDRRTLAQYSSKPQMPPLALQPEEILFSAAAVSSWPVNGLPKSPMEIPPARVPTRISPAR